MCNAVYGLQACSPSGEDTKSWLSYQSAYRPTLSGVMSLSHCLLRPAYAPLKATLRVSTKSIPIASLEQYKAVMFMYSTYFSSRYGPREAYGSPRFSLQDYPHPHCVIRASQNSSRHQHYTPYSAKYKCFEKLVDHRV